MKIISENVSFDGVQGVYSHTSKITGTDMTFAVYVPPQQRMRPARSSGISPASPAPTPT